MSGWFRAPYVFKHRMTLINNVLARDIYHMIRSCEAGQKPIHNIQPFINIRRIFPEERDPYKAAAHEAATISEDMHHLPSLHSIWIKEGCEGGRYVMSRTWIHERNRSLYWLTAIQRTDTPFFYLNAENTWFPYRDWLRQKGDGRVPNVGA